MKASLKKVLAVCFTVALMASVLAGCSGSGDSASDKVYKIGICQLVQHDALDAATQGFQDAVVEKLGKDNVEFDLQNAGGDSNTCATITNQFVADGDDLIMANATPALQAAMTSTADIPIVATSVTDFATALEIKDWTGKSGINVTGTADLAPLEQQAAMIKELFPNAKKVGILYCSAESNSKYQANVITEELKKLQYEVNEYTVADTNQIADVTKKAVGEVDVIYIPTDNTIASATAAVKEIVEPAKIPVVASEEGICKGCGVATLAISYYDLGHNAGEMAAKILAEGADPAEMEIAYASDLTKEFIKERMQALNITVPEDYEELDMTEAE